MAYTPEKPWVGLQENAAGRTMEGTRRVCDEKCGGTQTQLVALVGTTSSGATNHPVVQPAVGSWPQTARDWPIGLFTSYHTACVLLRAATQMGSSTLSLSLSPVTSSAQACLSSMPPTPKASFLLVEWQ